LAQFVLALERVLFVYLAISMAMKGEFTVGMIFAFQAYKQQFLDAATRLVDFAIRYRLLDVHLNRIADIALSKPEHPATPRSESLAPVRGAIELRNVGFRYGVGEPDVLRGVNLKIEAGEMVALVGPSGGGKTTLLNIMMGLLEPSYGQVLVDGKPLASFGLQQWRQSIGSVAQDDVLFAGSLAENIAFFDPEIDMEQVVEAAKQAAIHDTIESMPMRYDTLVGDMGSALSGGQRQRVPLARALYPNPALLFIDEGTAHLDVESERQAMGALLRLPITRLISAHRPGAIAHATRTIVVLGGLARELAAQPSAAA
jgi:ATP-binding cassette subfamily B protein RaxB